MGSNLLKEKLNSYDNNDFLPLWEYGIHRSLENLITKEKLSVDDIAKAELMAFAFLENNKDEQSYWGTYYWPITSHTNDNKVVEYEYPPLSQVTPKTIDYWEKRGSEAAHPVLVSRYLGLVWDFSFKVKNSKPNHLIGERYVTSLLAVVKGRLYKEPTYAKIKVKRALSVALSLNNEKLINETKYVIIALEKEIGVDEKPGRWGFVYDLLYAGKKNLLSNKELEEMIMSLETKMSNLKSSDPWACKAAVNRLADYYNRSQRSEDVKRVLFVLGESYLSYAEKSSSIHAAGYIEELYHIFNHYKLNKEANELLVKLREEQKKTISEFKRIATTVDIPNEKIKQYVEKVLKGSGDEIFIRILLAHIPSLKSTEKDLSRVSKKHPIRYLMKTGIVDQKGRTVAQIGSIEDDFEGHKAVHFSNLLKTNGVLLHIVLKEAVKRNLLTASSMMSFLQKSCILGKERYLIIEQGITEYLKENHIVSIHLLVPQFEEAIRNLIEINGGNILTYKGGAYQLKTFDHLLKHSIVKEVLGEDMSFYYRILFTESRGWNLRNNLAHGLIDPVEFDKQVNDWVIHALLVLGMIRWEAVPE